MKKKFRLMPPGCETPPTLVTTPDARERVLSFRVTFHDLDTLKRKARKEGTTVSTVIRKALEKVDGK